ETPEPANGDAVVLLDLVVGGRVGKRQRQDPLILEVDSAAAMMADVYIGQAGPTVFVTRGVPPDFVEIAEEPEDFELPPSPERITPRRDRIDDDED
ncbi:MAG: hypothetical protein LN414_03150, partial [Candidatus Thermoplasmatota archaeon]|nr:hypothetical protein [Candidatus Thermoplasmatota archaeon]